MNSDEKLCIDGVFTPKQLEIWERFGVSYPQEGKLYTFRKIIKHTNGKTGVVLNEIINPDVPLDLEGKPGFSCEPNFSIKRFVNLDQTEISEEEIMEATRNKKKELVKIPLKSKENEKILHNFCTKF